MIYLDNILIYSNNMSIYHWHIKEVLKQLCKAGLYAKVKKSKFYSKFYSKLVKYLKYIYFSSGLTILDNKVKIIQNWSKLKKFKKIQSFLGFVNFYY